MERRESRDLMADEGTSMKDWNLSTLYTLLEAKGVKSRILKGDGCRRKKERKDEERKSGV